jgi:hypothetical protein
MNVQTIDDLRATVRKLKPTGPDGFEGLMAAVLTDLPKRSFALASSGSQRGKDGQSALDDGAISFEGKRPIILTKNRATDRARTVQPTVHEPCTVRGCTVGLRSTKSLEWSGF